MELPAHSTPKLFPRLALLESIISSLERLSADSYWAHRASGLRGSLLRLLDQVEAEGEWNEKEEERLNSLIERGFAILESAAKEIVTPDVMDLFR